MPFDPTTARPAAGGFDPATAQPAPATASGAAPVNADRAAQGQDIGQDAMGSAGSMLWAALHGAADTATFGLADKAAAGMAHLISPATGQPMSYDEAYSRIQANNAKSRGASPVSAAVGDVAGVAVGAGGLAKVASKIPGVARAAEALAPVAKQPFTNVSKAALTAGVASGGYTAADEAVRNGSLNPDQIATNTVVGGALGPAVSKIGGAIARGVQNSSTKAMTLLASKLGETPDVLQRAFDNFNAATGRVPTMAELVGMKSQGELKALAANNPTIQEGVNNAADTAAAQRPMSLSQTIEDNGGPGGAQSISQLTQARAQRMTQAMDPIRDTRVGVDTNDAGLLDDPRVRSVIRADPQLSQRVRDAVEEARTQGQSDALTVNDIDSIRKSLRGQQTARANQAAGRDYNPHIAAQFGNLADNIGALGTAAEPGYADALDQFTKDSHYIKGFKHGYAGKTIGQADNQDLINSLNEAEGIAGHQAGIVTRTSDAAASSPAGATRTAAELAAGGGDSANLRGAVGQQGFSNIQNAAEAEDRGATALSNISGRVAPEAEGFSGKQVAQTVGAAASHSPAGVLFHAARAIPSMSKLPPAVQQQVARYLTNPDMTQQGINLLRRAGATDAQLRKLSVALSANAGLNTASN